MKKTAVSLPLFCFSIIFASAGCVTDGVGFGGISTGFTGGGISSPSGESQLAASKQVYTGPKVRVAIMAFENKTGHVTTVSQRGGQVVMESDPIGSGMSEQLTTALMQTGMFSVIERQGIGDVLAEQHLTGDGTEQLSRPDYLIRGAVTEYQISQQSQNVGIGTNALAGSVSPAGIGMALLGGIAASARSGQDHVAIDLRLIDSRTGEVVAATSIEGKARDLSHSIGGMFGNTFIATSGQYRTPISKAVRACSIQAANWLGEQMMARQNLERYLVSD